MKNDTLSAVNGDQLCRGDNKLLV